MHPNMRVTSTEGLVMIAFATALTLSYMTAGSGEEVIICYKSRT